MKILLRDLVALPEKRYTHPNINGYDKFYNEAIDTIGSLPVELDEEALARILKSANSVFYWENREKKIGEEIADENLFIAASIAREWKSWLRGKDVRI